VVPPPTAAPIKAQATYDQIAEQRLVEFVDKQINDMQSRIQLGNGHEPSFSEVNDALMSYQDTHLALLSMYHNSKFEHARAKERFDEWFAEKYMMMREELNPRSLSAQKWVSQKEIEMAVRNRYKKEFSELNWNITLADQQLSFMRRMLDNWGQYAFILNQLSKNLIAEVSSLGLDSALNQKSERY
jgi:hypothetical protein